MRERTQSNPISPPFFYQDSLGHYNIDNVCLIAQIIGVCAPHFSFYCWIHTFPFYKLLHVLFGQYQRIYRETRAERAKGPLRSCLYFFSHHLSFSFFVFISFFRRGILRVLKRQCVSAPPYHDRVPSPYPTQAYQNRLSRKTVCRFHPVCGIACRYYRYHPT